MHNDTDRREPSGAADTLTLPLLLNILFRRRLLILVLTALGLAAGVGYGIVVRPLYRAMAQVRPGIVAYAADGMPLREWALEDVVRWFDNQLYWSDLHTNERFADAKVAPIIDAEFIPSLNFVAGGDVITLTNLARSREKAFAALDGGIASFNGQARLDSLGSTLHLTLRAGRQRVERLRRDIERVDADEERASLNIAQQERELSLIDLEQRGVEHKLKELAAEIAWRRDATKALREEAVGTQERLASARELLRLTMDTERETGSGLATGHEGGPVSEVLLQTASREQAGRAGELLLTVNRLSNLAVDRVVKADSLAAHVKAMELERERLQLVLEIEIAKKKADVRQKIRDLQIQLERDLPYNRAVMQSDLNTESAKLELVSPLERVGAITVSEKPVRPRKLRAAAILTFLAFCGSLVLALMVEYLQRNRDVITAGNRA